MKVLKGLRRPWSVPHPPHSGFPYRGCTEKSLAPVLMALCLLKSSAISLLTPNLRVNDVPGVYFLLNVTEFFLHKCSKKRKKQYVERFISEG